ncbi:protein of unknown function [Desulfonispora thiosulfatigenes DSM 11270]|uniref:DUF4956 domain-containing protein n=1 Tax=Desulfonispora thiosulfatigenes DSM 11270 TaxID=656914 RepID=A0A1W1V6M5_DESTI|nr:DUF4956 domain-containing protein [Desulfonispora thiosulfatigenes]SMB89038.1 protein of unknown function [Desulfonispora thiosulfatigenes DSM 11270]
MNEFILENLTNTESLKVSVILLNNIVALAVVAFIMLTYRITYTGTAYSKKYNISLGMIAIITTMIMSVISNNLALSLGMVGALSIIRFRTAVKDVRDSAFIFWAIASGIGCGVSQYMLIAIGSFVLFVFLLIMRQISPDNRQLIIIQTIPAVQNKVEGAITEHLGKKVRLTMKNLTKETCEMVYTVSEGALEKANQIQMVDIVQKLIKIEGVHRVNVVEQLDDISR